MEKGPAHICKIVAKQDLQRAAGRHFQLRELDPGAQLDLVEDRPSIVVGQALAPLRDGMGHAAQRAAGDAAGQKAVPHFIEQS